jgi:hypothetical protein
LEAKTDRKKTEVIRINSIKNIGSILLRPKTKIEAFAKNIKQIKDAA